MVVITFPWMVCNLSLMWYFLKSLGLIEPNRSGLIEPSRGDEGGFGLIDEEDLGLSVNFGLCILKPRLFSTTLRRRSMASISKSCIIHKSPPMMILQAFSTYAHAKKSRV